jgi:uncharacterized protein (DUF1330 family)
MAAYAIGRLQRREPPWLQAYGPKTLALVHQHGGFWCPSSIVQNQTDQGTSLALTASFLVFSFP